MMPSELGPIQADARTDLFDYIERFHNPRRRRTLALKQAGLLPFS
ncbi:MAG: hypothetical protein ACI91G_000922 [Gammaproteobacteria bacterium]|jgi:hypothetical protein